MTRGRSPQSIAARQNLKAAALDFIREHVDTHGYPPTIAVLGAYLGFRSTGSTHTLLAELQAEGRIRRVKGSPRAITVVDDNRASS